MRNTPTSLRATRISARCAAPIDTHPATRRASRILGLAAIAATAMTLGVAGVQNASAQTVKTWITNPAANSTNWSQTTNWSGGTPVAGNLLAFTNSTLTTLNNDLTAGTSFAGILFTANASAFTLNGNAITLTGGITNNSTSAQIINNNLTVNSNITIYTIASGGNTTLGGNLSGSGTISQVGTATGAYTLNFNGTNSGFTGYFTSDNQSATRTAFNNANAGSANARWDFNRNVNGGVALNFGAGTISFGALSGGAYFRNNNNNTTTTIRVGDLTNNSTSFSGQLQQNSTAGISLLKAGTGTFTLTGTGNNYAGPTIITNGAIVVASGGSIGSGSLSINSGASLIMSNTTLGGQTFSGGLSGAGTFTQGSTNLTIFSGTSTYTGTYQIQAGAIEFQNTNAWGSAAYTSSNGVVLSNGGAVIFGVTNFGTANLGTLYSTFTAGTGTAVFGYDTTGTNYINASNIIDTTKTVGIASAGSGTLTLTGNNTFTGGVRLFGGTLGLTNVTGNGIGANTITVANNSTVNALSGLSLSNAMSFLGGSTLTLNNGGFNVTNSANITGSGALSLSGAGTTTFSGSNNVAVGVGNGVTIALVANAANTAAGVAYVTGQIGGAGTGTSGYRFLSDSNVTFNGFDNAGGWAGGVFNFFAGNVTAGNSNRVISFLTNGTMWQNMTNNFDGTNGYSFALGTLTQVGAQPTLFNANSASVTIKSLVANNGYTAILGGTNTGYNAITNGITTGSGKTTTLSKTGSGTWYVLGASTSLGNTTISGGTLVLGGTLNAGNYGGTIANSGALVMTNSAAQTLSGAITGTGSFAQSGTGTTTLSVSNNYSGGTTVNAGQLLAGAANSLGTNGGNLTVNGGTANLSTFNFTNGTVTLAGGTLTGSGTLTATNGYAVSGGTASVILAGASTLTKTGSGTATLNLVNTYSGGTVISAGQLTAGTNNAMGTGSLGVSNGATLSLGTFNASNAAVTLASGAILSGSGTLTGTSFAISDGTIVTTLAGTGATFAKNGVGTLVLNSTNLFSGATTINGGTLKVGATNGIAASSGVTIASGGTLQFDTASSTLTIGGLTMSGNAILALTQTSASVTTAGNVSISGTGGTNVISLAGLWSTLGTYNLVNFGTLTVGDPNNLALVYGGNGTATLGNSFAYNNKSYTLGSNASSIYLTISSLASALFWSDNPANNQWNTTDLNWSTQTNGGGTAQAFTAGNDVTFGEKATNGAITAASPITAGIIAVTNTAGSVVLNGAGSISGTTFTKSGNGNLVISNALILSDAMIIGGTNNTTLAGSVSALALTMNGAGSLTLGSSNAFSNSSTINSGSVLVGNDGALGTNAVTISGRATLQGAGTNVTLSNAVTIGSGGAGFAGSNNITLATGLSGSAALSKTGSGTLALNAAGSYSGAATVDGGAVQLNNATALGSGNALTINSASGLLFGSGVSSVTFGSLAGNGSFNLTNSAAGAVALNVGGNNASTTFSGSIGGTGALTKAGTGTQTLSGSNSYSGGTTINAGTLLLGNAAALGSSNGVAVNTGGTLDLGGFNEDFSVVSGSGTITSSIGGATLSLTTNGTIANTLAGLLSFRQNNGSTTVTLSASNSYSGGTAVNAGTLALGNNNALGVGIATINNGGRIDLSTTGLTITNNLSVSGNSLLSLVSGGAGTYNGNISGSGTLTYFADFYAANLTLGGSNSGFLGTFLQATNGAYGNNNGSRVIFGSANAGSAGANWVFNDTSGSQDRVNLSFGTGTISFGALSGVQSITANNGGGGATTVRVGDLNSSTTYSAGLKEASGNTITLLKVGTGTLTLASQNAYTGGTVVNQGALSISNGGSIGGIRGALTINTNATVNLLVGDALGYGTAVSTVTINGGTLNNAAANNNGYVTSFVLNGGNVTSTGGGRFDVQSGYGVTSLSNSATSLWSAQIMIRNTGNLSISNALGSTLNGIDLQFSGPITEQYAGSTVTKTGNGTTLLSGTNTYTGTTTISGGSLIVSGLLGNGSYGGSIANSASLIFSNSAAQTLSGNITGSGTLTMAGTGTTTLSASNNYSGDTVVNGGTLMAGTNNAFGTNGNNLTVNGGTADLGVFNATNGTVTLAGGTLTGSGTLTATNGYAVNSGRASLSLSGSTSLTKSGAGSVTLSGANSYTGATTVNGGTLVAGSSTAFGRGDLNVNSGATADIGSNNLTQGAVTLASGAALNGTGVLTGTNFTLNNSGTIAASLAGAANVTKSGPGNLTLTGSNTYTGITTINGGTLQLNGSLVSSSGLVLDGASLSMTNGLIQSLNFGSGGLNLAASGASSLSFDVLGDSNDSITTTSLLTLGNGNVIINLNNTGLAVGVTNTLMTWGTASIGSGSFTLGSYNDLGFGLNGIQLITNETSLQVTALGNSINTAYWVGDQGSVWTNNNGSVGNFATNAADTTGNANALPSVVTDVYFAQSTNSTNTLGKNFLVKSLNFIGSGTTTIQNDGSTLSIGTGGLNVNSGSEASVAVNLLGSGGVTNNGSLTLSGSNSYSGGTLLQSGTLVAGNQNALGTGGVAMEGGNLTVAASNLVVGQLTNNAGTLDLNGYNLTLTNPVAGDQTGFASTVGGTVVNNSSSTNATLTVNSTLTTTYDVFGPSYTLGAQFGANIQDGINGKTLALVKTGSGYLTIFGNNTYSGGTFINGGTLVLGNNTALPSSGDVTVNGGSLDLFGSYSPSLGGSAPTQIGSLYLGNGTVTDSWSGVGVGPGVLSATSFSLTNGVIDVSLTGTGALTKNGSGTVVLNAVGAQNGQQLSYTYTGGTVVNGGTLNASANGVTLPGSGSLTVNGGTLALGANNNTVGAFTMGGGTLSGTGTLTSGSFTFNNVTATVDESLAGSGATLTNSGTGTLTLAANNSYSGNTVISGGTLIVSGLLGSGDYAGSIQNGGALILSNSSSQTLSGAISGNGYLAKRGNSTLILSGINSYIGGTLLSAGQITLGNNSALGTGSVTNTAGGTIDLNGYSLTNVLSLNGSGVGGNGALVNNSVTAGIATNIALTGSTTLGGSGNTTVRFTANNNVTKTGSGTVTMLSSASTAGRLTVNSGTFILSNTNSSVFNEGFINSGGTLKMDPNAQVSTALGWSGNFTQFLTVNAGGVWDLNDSGMNGVNNRFKFVYGSGTVINSGTGASMMNIGARDTSAGKTNYLSIMDGTNGGTVAVTIAPSDGGWKYLIANFSGSNSYSGVTSMSDETLQAGSTNAFSPNSVVTQSWGALLDLNGYNNTVAGLAGSPNGGNNVALGAATLTLNTKAGSNLSFSGVITGSTGSVIMSGSGTQSLSGTSTYGGITYVNSGTLAAGNNSAFGTGTLVLNGGGLINQGGVAPTLTNNILVASNSQIRVSTNNGTLTLNGNISGNGSISYIADQYAGNLNLGGNNSGYNGVFTQNYGSNGTALNFTSASAGSANASWVFNDNNDNNRVNLSFGSGTISFGSLSGVAQINNTATGAGTTTIRIGDSGFNSTYTGGFKQANRTNQLALLKVGSGTLTLAPSDTFVFRNGATNSYAGGTTVNGGTLVAGNATAFGTGGMTVNSGGTLDLAGFSYTFAGLGGSGTVTSSSGSANLTLSNTATNNTVGNALTGLLAVVKSGTGTTTLSASNSYTGTTTVNGGELALGTSSSLGNSTNAVVVNSGTLNLGGNNVSVGSLTGSGTVTNSGVAVLILTNGAGSNSAFGGSITGGGLTKGGSGTLTLTGQNSYSGATTVNGGALSVNADNTISSLSAVSLANNALFQYTGGAGTLGNNFTVSSNSTGTIRNSGGGLLTLSGTLTKQGSILQFYGGSYNVTGKITGNSGSFNSDLVLSNAAVTLSNEGNDFVGPTTLLAGSTLTAGVNNALPTSTKLYLGATGESSSVTNGYSLNGNNQTLGGLYSAGNGVNRIYNDSATQSLLTLAGNSTFGGSIAGNIGLTVNGGSVVNLTGLNSYTGGTRINGGGTIDLGGGGRLTSTSNVIVSGGSTLLLGGNRVNNPVNTQASMQLGGNGNSSVATLSMGGLGATSRTASQSFTTLTLTGNSVIDFAALTGTSSLTFSSITGLGTYTLSIYNWNGTNRWGTTSETGGVNQYTQLFVNSGLSSSNLANISFYSGAGTGFMGAGSFSGTEIVPVPEPSVVIAACMLLGWLLVANRGTLLALLRRLA